MTESSTQDTLVVVSKLKKYIKEKAELNTSGAVADTLSTLIRVMCDKAIENAKNEGRKTVMERDFASIQN
jgi:histone H3/H4